MTQEPWIRIGDTIRSADKPHGPDYIALLGEMGNREANARRILSASDLLEALERLIVEREGHYSTAAAWDAARSAAAKARGEV